MATQITPTTSPDQQLKTYSYKARDATGKIVSGTGQAADRADVIAELLDRGAMPLHVSGDSWFSTLMNIQAVPRRRIRARDLIDLMRELASMYSSHLDPLVIIEIARGEIRDPFLASVMRNIHTLMIGGMPLAEAMREQGEAFPPDVIELVAAAQDANQMHTAMDQIADDLERADNRRSKIIRGLVYPAILVVVAVGVIIYATLVIIPGFSKSFEAADAELPFMTQMLLAFSGFMQVAAPIGAGAIAVSTWLYVRNRNKDAVRVVVDRYKTRVHVLGPLSHHISLATLCRTLSNLLGANLHPVAALRKAAKTCKNIHMERALLKAADLHNTGTPLSQCLRDEPLFPPTIIQYLLAGEKGNRTAEMIGHAANKYEKSVERRADNLATSLGPAVVVLVAIAIGFLVMAISAPNLAFIDAVID